MGDISKGVTFADGDTVDAAKLNSHVDDATLKVDAITTKTAAGSIASGDQFLIYQLSSAGLRSVNYSVLSAAILSGAATTASRKAINQVGHGFVVGDVILRSKAGTNYQKAKATYLQQTFATTDVDTANDRLALPSGTVTALTDGDKVFFTSGTTLPVALVTSRFYYVKKFDTTHVEVYKEVGLATRVDFTDTGAGTHTLHYGLPLWNAVGLVDAVVDANNFSLTYTGEVTTLSGLTDGVVYFLSPTTAGAVTSTPPTAEGQLAIPIYVATSATAASVWGGRPLTLSPYSVRADHMADQSVPRRALDSLVRQSLDRNIGADRQMVLSGSVDASGYANYLSPGSGLQVALAATATPLIVSFANGFDDVNGYNYVERITADQTFNSLPASTEAVFLYIDRDSSTGVLTYSFTQQPPEYGFAKTLYRDRGCVPKLTSNGGNANYAVSASSENGGDSAFKGFDKLSATKWQSIGNTAAQLVCQFQTPRVINAVSLTMWANPTFGPNTFTIEGSTNGSTWNTPTGASRSAITWPGTPTTQTFQFTNTTAYAYWRINISANNGGATHVIYDLNFHEAIDHYYVIPEASMYAYTGSWAKVNRVFVGECKTSAASVSAGNIYSYALRGHYISPIFTLAVASEYTKNHNIGTGWLRAIPLVRTNPSFPWPIMADFDGYNSAGLSCTAGQSDRDQRGDRLVLTCNTSTPVTRGFNYSPSRYSDTGEDSLVTGQAQLLIKRAF